MAAYRIAALVLCSCSVPFAQLNPPLQTLPDTNYLGLNIPRSLRLLSTNQPIRIVTAGQSIIDGNNQWHVRLMDSLRTRFSNTHITFLPHGVGACATDCQLTNHVAAIAADVPDLVIYYVYGWENYDLILYEINRQCTNDSLEFLILNNHITPLNPTAVHGNTYGVYMNDLFLPWMCEKWHAGLCDIHTPWAAYLADHSMQPLDLLIDSVHLNASGQWLMEDLVERYFVIRGADSRAPAIDSAYSLSPTRFKVCFSEKIERASASVATNYTVTGATVDGVVFGGDLKSAFVSTGVRAPGQYTVTVNGVRDLAGNAISGASRQFTSVADPGWQNIDIGMCAAAGTTTKNETAGTWRLTSTADNTWAYKNEYHYAYKTVYGDFDLKVLLATQGALPAQQNAMAGVCVREVPEYYARSMGVGIRVSGAPTYFLRQNERDTLTSRSATNRTTPQWFRIRRVGSTISMNYSNDGTTWANAPTGTWLTTSEVTVGMFALAGNYGSTQTANFTNVTLTGGTVPVTRQASPATLRSTSLAARWSPVDRSLRVYGLPAGPVEVSLVDAAGRSFYRRLSTGPQCAMQLPSGSPSVAFLKVRTANGETVRAMALR